MKKIILIPVLLLLMSGTSLAFSDTQSHKYSEAIEFISSKNIVNGYPDGSYQPDKTINRAELLKIIIESIDVVFEGANYRKLFEPYAGSKCFPDVEANQWYTQYICFAKDYNLVNGYSDGTFRPDQEISFVEALKITMLTFGYQNDEGNPWYKNTVDDASNRNLIPLDIYNFNQPFTRGQMAELITRIIKYRGDELESYLGSKAKVVVTYDTINQGSNMENMVVEEDPVEPSGSKICLLSDNLKSYQYDYKENISDNYDRQISINSAKDCRKEAIEFYNINPEQVVFLREGDRVTLDNNMTVEIAAITFSLGSGNSILDANHYINGKPLNFTPFRHYLDLRPEMDAMWNENYGYRLTINDIKTDGVTLTFTPLTAYLNSPEDLYNECMVAKNDQHQCFMYSLYDPLTNETKISLNNFTLFGPKVISSYMGYMGDQFENCYEEVSEYLGINKTVSKIPVHFLPNENGKAYFMGDNGLKWLYGEQTLNKDFSDVYKDYCANSIAAHEITHAIVRPAPFSAILDEGLATKVESVFDTSNFLTCHENGYSRYGEDYDFDDLSKFGTSQGSFEQYYTAACFWEEYINDQGMDNFLATMRVLESNKAPVESVSFFQLVKDYLGIDMEYYRDKYGFGSEGDLFLKMSGWTTLSWDIN